MRRICVFFSKAKTYHDAPNVYWIICQRCLKGLTKTRQQLERSLTMFEAYIISATTLWDIW